MGYWILVDGHGGYVVEADTHDDAVAFAHSDEYIDSHGGAYDVVPYYEFWNLGDGR